MKKKITSFTLRVLLMAVFYFLAYEYWLDRSVADTVQIIITTTLVVILMRAWEFFKRRHTNSNKTKTEED